jgi:hypothetical protein
VVGLRIGGAEESNSEFRIGRAGVFRQKKEGSLKRVPQRGFLVEGYRLKVGERKQAEGEDQRENSKRGMPAFPPAFPVIA